jgi:hypothetical protein
VGRALTAWPWPLAETTAAGHLPLTTPHFMVTDSKR